MSDKNDTFATPRTVALEAELAATRRQLAATVDELTDRLDPKANATKAVEGGKKLVQDAVGSTDAAPEERNRARLVLGGVVGALALVVTLAVRRRH